jgi:hypothetical protein
MSRSYERAYDLVVRGDEVLSLETISQLRAENSKQANMTVATDGAGGFVMVALGSLGGGLPEPPLGTNDALTVDPAGVVKWGGVVSGGEFG